jgi:tRNA 2-thiouridine synthesizing protein A
LQSLSVHILYWTGWVSHRQKSNLHRQCGLIDANSVELEIDVVGLRCPLPVLKLKKRIEPLPPGSLVRLITSDPTTLKDVPSYCTLVGHELVSLQPDHPPFEFFIRMAGKT